MPLLDEDKTEIDSMIKSALDKIKEIVPTPPAGGVTPPAIIPVPNPPKSNEELETEIKKEENKDKQGNPILKILKAIW